MALGARSQQVVWSIARGVAGLIGVATSIGLVLTRSHHRARVMALRHE